jgi:hypothetical protein
MSVSYKNFWSLNVDEAVVTGILRDETTKDVEVLMPMNAQMKGVDLVLMNINTKKSITIQVKGSRAYEPQKTEIENYKEGSAGWFGFFRDVVDKATADYFVFLIYVIEQNDADGRRCIKPHIITIPTIKLKIKAEKKSIKGTKYNFMIWVKPTAKEAFDVRSDMKDNYLDKDYSEYLDKKGFEKLNNSLS